MRYYSTKEGSTISALLQHYISAVLQIPWNLDVIIWQETKSEIQKDTIICLRAKAKLQINTLN